MPITNSSRGDNKPIFEGYSMVSDQYFKIRVLDSTNWVSSRWSKYYTQYIDNTSFFPKNFNSYSFSNRALGDIEYSVSRDTTYYGLSLLNNVNIAELVITSCIYDASRERFLSGIISPSIDKNADFDFRYRFGQMGILNIGDTTSATIIGVFGNNTDSTNSNIMHIDSTASGIYVCIDSSSDYLRMFKIYVKEYNYEPVVIKEIEESDKTGYVFGQKNNDIQNNAIEGQVLHSLRIARNNRRFLIEWNFWSDNEYVNNMDSTSAFIKRYRNRFEYFHGKNNLFENNNQIKTAIYSYILNPDLAYDSLKTDTYLYGFEALPCVSLDSTGSMPISSMISTDGNNMIIDVSGRGQGDFGLKVSKILDGTHFLIRDSTNGLFNFVRKEFNSGRTHQYLFDNDLDIPKTNDNKRDLYINGITKNSNNIHGSCFPDVFLTGSKVGRDDGTFALLINRPGFLIRETKEDTTEFNITNSSSIYSDSAISYGNGANLPGYMHWDSTHWLGRSAKFDFMHNLVLRAQSGENPNPDQCRAFQRDSTSLYVAEVISDGTNHIIYTRIWNPYSSTLGSRVRVNSDLSIFNRNPTPSYSSEDFYIYSFKDYKPNVDILVFEDKHICVVTGSSQRFFGNAGVASRIFYESEDNGLTWSIKNKNSRTANMFYNTYTGESSYEGESQAIKQKNNDTFIHQFSQSRDSLIHQLVDKRTFSNKPAGSYNFNNLISFSKMQDQTIRNMHVTFDPVDEKFIVALTSIDGYMELLRSPKMSFNNVENFNNRESEYSWQSIHYSRPFNDAFIGKTFVSCDKDGDIICIASRRTDDTSFAIFRTNKSKDELNLMGRFNQSTNKFSGRPGTQITSMYSDYEGNMILASTGMPTSDTTTVIMNIFKYGILTNLPTELDYDHGWIYPQLPNPFGGSTPVLDTTTNGMQFQVNPSHGWAAFGGTTIAGIEKQLSDNIGKKGFKAEWQMLVNLNSADNSFSVSTSPRITFRLQGNRLNATDCEKLILNVGFSLNSVSVHNTTGVNYQLGTSTVDISKLRRYKLVVQRTSDSSAAGVLYVENLQMSNFEKIIYEEKIRFVTPLTSSATISGSGGLNGTNSVVLMTYFSGTLGESVPIHKQRSEKLNFLAENIVYRDSTTMEEFNPIPCNDDITTYLPNSSKIIWRGIEGVTDDRFEYKFSSASGVDKITDKEIYSQFRSVSDQTSQVVICFDSTDQSKLIQYFYPDVAILSNTNFRRCFIEGSNSSLLDAATAATYSKEVFFDIDTGVIPFDMTNYGISTVLEFPDKNWRINEHKDRYIQIESVRHDGTYFRHRAYKIDSNTDKSIKINTMSRFDTTQFMYYTIYDYKQSVSIDCTTRLMNWRIRIPESQSINPAVIGDVTAQGSVFCEPYRSIGEFDLGSLTKLGTDIDGAIELSLNSGSVIDQMGNGSTYSYGISRNNKTYKVTYSNIDLIQSSSIMRMFSEIYRRNKPVWVFEDQINNSRAFFLAKILKEPAIQKQIGDNMQTIVIEFEEIV